MNLACCIYTNLEYEFTIYTFMHLRLFIFPIILKILLYQLIKSWDEIKYARFGNISQVDECSH